jgi:tetratricopeptide (TPR) repeat protein
MALRGRLGEAEAALRRCLEILDRAGVLESGRGVAALTELATILQQRNQLDESLALRLRVLAIQKAVGPEDRGEIARDWNNLGSTYRLMKRYAQAESAFVAAIEGFRASEESPVNLFTAIHNLGKTKLDRGRAAEAEATLREAAAMAPQVLPDGHPNRAIFATTYGRALAAVGRVDEARRWLTEARDGLTATLGPDHARTKEAAEALASLGKP